MARKGMTVTTTVSFQVTFKLPPDMNIPIARDSVKRALINGGLIGIQDEKDLKVHLTNKEVSYGKR